MREQEGAFQAAIFAKLSSKNSDPHKYEDSCIPYFKTATLAPSLTFQALHGQAPYICDLLQPYSKLCRSESVKGATYSV